jgi:hypothetical protein
MTRKNFPNIPKIRAGDLKFSDSKNFEKNLNPNNPTDSAKIKSNTIQAPKTFKSSLEFDFPRSENSVDQKEIAREMQSLQKKKLLQEKEVAKAQRRQIRKQKWENFIKPFKATWRVVFSILKTIYWVVVFLLMVIQEIWEILTYFFKPRKYK